MQNLPIANDCQIYPLEMAIEKKTAFSLQYWEQCVTFGLLNLDHDTYNPWQGPEMDLISSLCLLRAP